MFKQFLILAALFCWAGCQSTPSQTINTQDVSRASAKQAPRWSAKQIFTVLPDSLFDVLKSQYPEQYEMLKDKNARAKLMEQHPVINETCLSHTLETEQDKKRRETEYQESHLLPELQLCFYAMEDDNLVVYLQLIHNCYGDCASPQQKVILSITKKYFTELGLWADYQFNAPEEEKKADKPAKSLYLLTPKGICLRSAVENFTSTRHRNVSSQTDVARMVWESDACRVWNGNSFE